MTIRNQSAWLAWLCYAVVVFVWGSTYFATAVGFETFTPMGMLSLRFAMAAAFSFAVGMARRERFPSRREAVHLIVIGVVMLGFANALVMWAIQFIPTGLAAVFMALTPLWLAFFNFKGENFGPLKLIGIALGVIGVAILVAPEPTHELHRLGVAAMFLAPIVWALGTLYARRYLTKGLNFIELSIELCAATFFGFALIPFTKGIMNGPITMAAILAIGYLSILGSFIAYAAYFYIVRVWQPSRVGTFTYLTPVIAILLGVAVLHESLSTRQILGMIIVLVAVALVQLGTKNH